MKIIDAATLEKNRSNPGVEVAPPLQLLQALEAHPTLAMAQITQGQLAWANAVWLAELDLLDERGAVRFDGLFVDVTSMELFWQTVGQQFSDGLACVEQRLRNRHGVTFTAEVLIHAATRDEAVAGNGLWLVRDASVEHDLRQKMRDLEKQSRVLGSYPWGLSLVLNKNFYLTYVSPSSEVLLGYRRSEMVGEQLPRYIRPEAMDAFKAHFLAVASGDAEAQGRTGQLHLIGDRGQQRRFQYRLLNCQNLSRVRGIVLHAADLDHDEAHRPVGQASSAVAAPLADRMSTSVVDIDLMADLGADLNTAVDGLTGLPNRRAAQAHLQTLFENNRQLQSRLALLWIDLDRFHHFNDAHGYAAGDTLLQRVAVVLREEMQAHAGQQKATNGNDANDWLARMGSDEFLIALSGSSQTQLESLAERLIQRLHSGALVPQFEQHLGASIGLALDTLDPQDLMNADSLVMQAESAALQARKYGGNQALLFSPKLARRRRVLRELDAEVRAALERQEFRMFYQPQFNLRTGQVVGVEALLRWQHPERGLLLPAVFMEALQQNKLLDVLTRWTLTQAGEQSGAWQRAGVRDMPVSVNLTEYQFSNPHLPAIVASVLMKTAIPARNLILEVSESGLIENSPAQERITEELKQLGVRLAIDDFGVGYSSLNYLRRLIVSQIKLGKAFVEGLPDQAESSAIVAAIIAISRSLKFQVVAEYVENQAQVDHLRSLGCDLGQGFHLSAPLQAKEFQQLALSC